MNRWIEAKVKYKVYWGYKTITVKEKFKKGLITENTGKLINYKHVLL